VTRGTLAMLAAFMLAQGCAHRPGWQVYDAAQQEQIDEHEDRLRALEGNPCPIHSETDSTLYQDDWPDYRDDRDGQTAENAYWEGVDAGLDAAGWHYEPTMGTRGAMCRWHSPEAHENANAKGYRLECEE
jgi:hypothetical protein